MTLNDCQSIDSDLSLSDLDLFCFSAAISTFTVLMGSLVSAYSTKIPVVDIVDETNLMKYITQSIVSHIPGNMMFFHNLPISFFSPSLFFLK